MWTWKRRCDKVNKGVTVLLLPIRGSEPVVLSTVGVSHEHKESIELPVLAAIYVCCNASIY
jgi:hypothetical protein